MTDLMKRLADALHTAATYLDMRSQAEWQQEVRALLRECAAAEREEVQPVAWMLRGTHETVWHEGAKPPLVDMGWTPLYAAPLAAASTREAVDWQPIETAPKDELVLLLAQHCNSVLLGRWGDYCRINQPKFTHWMPLPPLAAAPTPKGER